MYLISNGRTLFALESRRRHRRPQQVVRRAAVSMHHRHTSPTDLLSTSIYLFSCIPDNSLSLRLRSDLLYDFSLALLVCCDEDLDLVFDMLSLFESRGLTLDNWQIRCLWFTPMYEYNSG